MGWTATIHPNPTDPHPVTFVWEDGELISSDDPMLRAVERLASDLDKVGATPTGPFEPADLSVGHVAFRVVVELALVAGVEPDDIEVEGEGWDWPDPGVLPPDHDLVY